MRMLLIYHIFSDFLAVGFRRWKTSRIFISGEINYNDNITIILRMKRMVLFDAVEAGTF